MTDKEKMIELCKKLGLSEVNQEIDLGRQQYFVSEQKVLLGSGGGYSGFIAEFTFNQDGSIYSHSVWE